MNNKFILSEKEKSRISNLHNQKILLERGFEYSNQNITEQVNYYKDTTGKIIKLEGPKSAPLGTEPATEQEYLAQNPTITVTPPQGDQKAGVTEPRYKTTTCPGKDTKQRCDNTVLKIQVRMNDECVDLNPKLAEDGVIGNKTTSAWGVCKSKLTPTKTVQGGGGQQQGGQQQGGQQQGPKIGEPLSANDIATLTTQ